MCGCRQHFAFSAAIVGHNSSVDTINTLTLYSSGHHRTGMLFSNTETRSELLHIPSTCAYSVFILLSDDNVKVSRRLKHKL